MECHCGNQYDTLGPSTGCTSVCDARYNSDYSVGSCGGASALSVYVNDEGFPDVPALESGLYCGCAKDTVYDRDLDVYMISSVTQQGCIAYCKENGYSKLY